MCSRFPRPSRAATLYRLSQPTRQLRVNKLTMRAWLVLLLCLCSVRAFKLAPHANDAINAPESVLSPTEIKADLSRCRRKWRRSQSKCTRALQDAIHVPEVCAFQYLNRISRSLVRQAPLLFSPATNRSVILTFQATYNVTVTMVDWFGRESNYLSDGSYVTSSPDFMTQDAAHSVLNVPGFNRSPATQNFYYTVIIRTENGELQYVHLTMPLVNDPIFC